MRGGVGEGGGEAFGGGYHVESFDVEEAGLKEEGVVDIGVGIRWEMLLVEGREGVNGICVKAQAGIGEGFGGDKSFHSMAGTMDQPTSVGGQGRPDSKFL